MEEVFEHVYLQPVPIPGSPLKWINGYIIRGKDRGLLIDTAFNNEQSERAILKALDALDLTLDRTDILITHMHVDHAGLAHRLKRPGNRIYASAEDARRINGFQHPERWDWLLQNNRYTGVPANKAMDVSEHIAYHNRPDGPVEFSTLQIGDRIEIANYCFQVIDLCGHTPGHIGLYEHKRGMLFSGDHLLKGIFPLITAWDLQVDYLQRYVDTLSALKNLNIHTVFPAHRGRDIDVCERVEAAISYHERQLESIRHILKRHGWMNAYQVARHMQWNMHGTFDGYSKMQTWFACSEALAHLQHLYFCGEVRKKPYSVPNLFCLEDSI